MKKNPGRKDRRNQSRAERIKANYTASLGIKHAERIKKQSGG